MKFTLLIFMLSCVVQSNVDWYDDLFINDKLDWFDQSKDVNKAGYSLKNIVGLKNKDFEYKGLSQNLYFDYYFNDFVFMKTSVEKTTTTLSYEYYDRLTVKSEQSEYGLSSELGFRFDNGILLSLSGMYSLSDDAINDYDFGLRTKWIFSDFIESEFSLGYFKFNKSVLVNHIEFPKGEFIDANFSKGGFEISGSMRFSFGDYYSVKPILYVESLKDEDENFGYQVSLKGGAIWYGLELGFDDEYFDHNLSIGYYNSTNESEGLRYNVDEVKRYHHAEFGVSYLGSEYVFSFKNLKEMSVGYVKGALAQDTIAGFLGKRKELLSYNRLFPAGLDVIIGSSWYNYSAANKFDVPFSIYSQRTNYEIPLFKRLNLNLLYEHYFLDVEMKGVWFEIEKEFLSSKVYTHDYEIDVLAYLQRLELWWSVEFFSKHYLNLEVGQLFMVWKNFDEHEDAVVNSGVGNNGSGGNSGANGVSDSEISIDQRFDEFKWPSGFNFKVEYVVSF